MASCASAGPVVAEVTLPRSCQVGISTVAFPLVMVVVAIVLGEVRMTGWLMPGTDGGTGAVEMMVISGTGTGKVADTAGTGVAAVDIARHRQ